jgi:hypothetical protein
MKHGLQALLVAGLPALSAAHDERERLVPSGTVPSDALGVSDA